MSVPKRTVSYHTGYVEGRGYGTRTEFNDRYVEHIEKLLADIHNELDQKNEESCQLCGKSGYDGQGLLHTDECILVRIREVVKV